MNADWGGTPFANALVRGFVAAIILGALMTSKAYWWDGDTVNQAVGEGVIPALGAILTLLGYGVVDQNRANSGVVNTSDVPIQVAARKQRRKASSVAADFAPENLR